MEKKQKRKIIFNIIKKKIKLRYLFLLIVLLSSNTFAWFIYSKQVQNDLTVHVRAWKILFEYGDSPITNYVDIDVNNVYPGMPDFENNLKAYNKSDVSADLHYTIMSANIMGDEYITQESVIESGLELSGNELTSDQLIQKLADDYPFKINISVSSTEIDPEYGEATYTVRVIWPYESGNDVLDTLWGNRAYEFKTNNPTLSCISMVIKVNISQTEESEI